ncbi:TPA: hypothetical protein ACRRWH_004029 [Clostridioides difficile]|uniref:hypothetical protein n=1 Tax=Clostridioides difficile TaxID=1496 RepID=UPI0021D44D43|nr:hypothetical protein [Clostridioides difficile]MDI3038261.1 hypothetical protein [Clostridioides difficile]MDY6610572.1 hypothetical protein [Clostridioides difficile]
MICSLNTLSGKCASSIAMLPAFTSVFLLASTVLSSVTTSFSGVAGVSCFVLSSFKVSAFSAVSSCSLSVIFSCTSAFSVFCSTGTCSVLFSSTTASCTTSVFSCAMTGVGSPVSAVVVPIINAELTARTCFFFIVCSLLIFHKFFA